MLGFACDVMGGEGAPSYSAGEGFYALRVAAGLKPYCLLNAAHRVSPRLWNSCLYMGYLMGCNAEERPGGRSQIPPAHHPHQRGGMAADDLCARHSLQDHGNRALGRAGYPRGRSTLQ